MVTSNHIHLLVYGSADLDIIPRAMQLAAGPHRVGSGMQFPERGTMSAKMLRLPAACCLLPAARR
jgi:hypothetical protein